MLTKEKIHELVDHMPENFSTEDLIDEILLLQKIEAAQQQVKDGEFLTEEELDSEMDKW
jgi:hypothetical protein